MNFKKELGIILRVGTWADAPVIDVMRLDGVILHSRAPDAFEVISEGR